MPFLHIPYFILGLELLVPLFTNETELTELTQLFSTRGYVETLATVALALTMAGPGGARDAG